MGRRKKRRIITEGGSAEAQRHAQLVERVQRELTTQPHLYEIPKTSRVFRNRPIDDVLGVIYKGADETLRKRIIEINRDHSLIEPYRGVPDLVLLHPDDSITVVEVSASRQPRVSREQAFKAMGFKRLFESLDEVKECRAFHGYLERDQSLYIGPIRAKPNV